MYNPVYRHWFRVEWEGLEHIPREGGALLVANHAGAIPPDAAIDHARHRERSRAPGVRNRRELVPIGAHRRHVLVAPRRRHRAPRQRVPALARREQLALVFPEGTKATGKLFTRAIPTPPLRSRRLRRDRDAAGVPVMPIAVVGAEEAMPIRCG